MSPLEKQRKALREEFSRRRWLCSAYEDNSILNLRACTVKTEPRRINKTTSDDTQPITVVIPAYHLNEQVATYRSGATAGIESIVRRVAYLEAVGKHAAQRPRRESLNVDNKPLAKDYNYRLWVTPSIGHWYSVTLSGLVITKEQLRQLSSLIDTFDATA